LREGIPQHPTENCRRVNTKPPAPGAMPIVLHGHISWKCSGEGPKIQRVSLPVPVNCFHEPHAAALDRAFVRPAFASARCRAQAKRSWKCSSLRPSLCLQHPNLRSPALTRKYRSRTTGLSRPIPIVQTVLEPCFANGGPRQQHFCELLHQRLPS
jgi:hypothetical protein